VKVTIYVPDELAAEAKAAELSLSPICQRAIREELDRMKAKQAATSDLEAVVARLRGTVNEEEQEMRQQGREDGIEWARKYATARELRDLAGDFMVGEGGDFEAPHSIVDFFGAKDGELLISVRHQDDAYWHGFQVGASEVLDAVRPLL
jgi:hypothetical protein